jgi:hypothetical protein
MVSVGDEYSEHGRSDSLTLIDVFDEHGNLGGVVSPRDATRQRYERPACHLSNQREVPVKAAKRACQVGLGERMPVAMEPLPYPFIVNTGRSLRSAPACPLALVAASTWPAPLWVPWAHCALWTAAETVPILRKRTRSGANVRRVGPDELQDLESAGILRALKRPGLGSCLVLWRGTRWASAAGQGDDRERRAAA